MTADRLLFIGFPTLLSLLLHIVVASLLFLRWSGPTEVVASVPVALPIQATIVRTETAKATSKPKPKAKPKPKPAEIPTTKPEPPPIADTPQPKAAEPTPPEDIALQMDAEQLAAVTREELTSLIDAEQAASGAREPSLRDVVAATIQAAVISRWTRPPSARNGMVSILSIQLVPTGEVIGVGVIQSSGNTAFDRSAMTAVERAGRFPEIAKVDNRTFEANFRRFQLIFKPEDLRY